MELDKKIGDYTAQDMIGNALMVIGVYLAYKFIKPAIVDALETRRRRKWKM